MGANTCLHCGRIIPEGILTCSWCDQGIIVKPDDLNTVDTEIEKEKKTE